MPRAKITEYAIRLANTGVDVHLELADVEALPGDRSPTLEVSEANMQFFEGGYGLYRSGSDPSVVNGYGTMASYERVYHLMQTEDPVFFGWRDFVGNPERSSWTFSTDGEAIGEGFGEMPAESAADVLADALARSILRPSAFDPSPPRVWQGEQAEVTRRLTSAISAVMADPTRSGDSSLTGSNTDRLNANLAGVLTHLIERRF